MDIPNYAEKIMQAIEQARIEERKRIGYYLDENWMKLHLNTLDMENIPRMCGIIEILKQGKLPEGA